MITLKELFINILFTTATYYISKNVWITILSVLFFFLIIRFLYRRIRTSLLANNILKQAKGGEICLGLQQAGHPQYQDKQAMCGGMAPYINALDRFPTNNDLYLALCAVLNRGMIDRYNCLYQYISSVK